jgi:hypothetical protein
MTAPLEPARSSVVDLSKNSAALSEILATILASILAAASQLNVQPQDIIDELKRRIDG